MKVRGFPLRIPESVYAALRKRAKAEGMSMNQFAGETLRRSLGTSASALHGPNPAPTAAPWAAVVSRALALFGDRLAGILLFGSVARGTESERSDIDVLIALSSDTSIDRGLYDRWDEAVGNEVDRRISVHFAALPSDPEDAGSLWFEAALDGIILWEREAEISRLLSGIRRLFLSGRVERRLIHGHPYWRRNKP